ncbi:MAG: carbon storage regulator CsrA [Planctomycetes bacterium]|jgi:carbon storage regulator|nr:carbon storage regulator CsrA [Planctomycetota bacterium]
MLVLTRRKGESIILGDDVEVKILELHGSQVKVGIQAPQSLSVHRKEVYLAIERENKAAAESAKRAAAEGKTGEAGAPEAPVEGESAKH